MNRRTFLVSSAAVAAAAAGDRFRKGICNVIFPPAMSVEDTISSAREAGFSGIEVRLGGPLGIDASPDQLKRVRDASRKHQVEIVSVWPSQLLNSQPLNHPDPAVRARGIEVIRKTIPIAAALDCKVVLIVAGRLSWNEKLKVGYDDTWERSAAGLRQVLPDAGRAKVMLCVENVWGNFLMSPREMRNYVDQFQSPWLRAYLDIGNLMRYGFPPDWIRALGPRIQRIHIKDYKTEGTAGDGKFVPLLEGSVDWRETMQALVQAGYRGWLSPEIGHNPNDPEHLRKVSQALDRIIAMA